MIAVVSILHNKEVIPWAIITGFMPMLFVWGVSHVIGWVRRLIEYA